MIFLWSTSDKPGAKIIRWGLDEPSSHFAMCFFEERQTTSLVVESRMGHGAQPRWLGDFLDENRIVHALQFPQSTGEDAQLFHSTSAELVGLDYDDHGVLFWSWIALQRKLFDTPLPEKNEWDRSSFVYCVEVMQAMGEFLLELGIDIEEFDLGMTSPEMAFRILEKSIYLRDITDSNLFKRAA